MRNANLTTIEEQVAQLKQEIIDGINEIPASMGLEVTSENILTALRSDFHRLSIKAYQTGPRSSGNYDSLGIQIKALKELIAEYEQRIVSQ